MSAFHNCYIPAITTIVRSNLTHSVTLINDQENIIKVGKLIPKHSQTCFYWFVVTFIKSVTLSSVTLLWKLILATLPCPSKAVSGGFRGGHHELVRTVRSQASTLLRDAPTEGWNRPADRGLHPQPPGLELRSHRCGDGPEGVSQT